MQNIYVSLHNVQNAQIEVCSNESGGHYWLNVGHLTLFFSSLETMAGFGQSIIDRTEREVARLAEEKSAALQM